jgi:hypothetical protein
MVFRTYTQTLTQASKAMAKGVFVVGLLLIGFGMLIVALPEVFVFLAAGVFFLFGFGCVVTAVKIYWAQRSLQRSMHASPEEPFRENVRVHQTQIFEERF